MSPHLYDEIAKLVVHTRRRGIHDHNTINELNIAVGYAYLLHFRPQYWEELQKHLEVFSDLARTRGHLDLCDHSAEIIEMMNGSER
jgi:hypothetical protein